MYDPRLGNIIIRRNYEDKQDYINESNAYEKIDAGRAKNSDANFILRKFSEKAIFSTSMRKTSLNFFNFYHFVFPFCTLEVFF